MIALARRFLRTGSFTVSRDSPLPPVVQRMQLADQGPYRPRFLPGTPLAHVPLHLVDRALGLDGPPQAGWLVHYTGHACVLLALGLLASAARSAGASPAAAAMGVVVAGCSWPVWQIARHGGAEPVVGLALAGFVWGVVSPSRATRIAVCALLPWLHPTGAVVAGVVIAAGAADPASHTAPRAHALFRYARGPLLAASLAALSVMLIWNLLYHGSWWGGGYAYSVPGALLTRSPLRVFLDEYLIQCATFAAIPALLAASALRQGLSGLRLLALPGGLFLAIAGLFSFLSYTLGHDPVRRLAVVWLSCAYTVARVWDGLDASPRLARGLLLLSPLLGVYWFTLREWNYYRAADGSMLPLVQWLTWWREGSAWWWLWPAACALLGLWAGARLWAGLSGTRTGAWSAPSSAS